MKKLVYFLALLTSIACSKDGGPSTIPNATWSLEKIVLQLGESEYEITDPPSVNITIQDETFSYTDGGKALSGSWTLDPSSNQLKVTNPDGVALTFDMITFNNERWTFVAQVVDLKKTSFTPDEDVALDMVNMKLIELGKKLDDEMAANSSLKILFVMKRV